MSTLARDMGASPGLWELLRTHGPFITLVYCFSAAFTSHYRLVGPFKSDKAPEVVRTEIWDTVTRRGLLVCHPSSRSAVARELIRTVMQGNIFMGVIPMAFYAIVNVRTVPPVSPRRLFR